MKLYTLYGNRCNETLVQYGNDDHMITSVPCQGVAIRATVTVRDMQLVTWYMFISLITTLTSVNTV